MKYTQGAKKAEAKGKPVYKCHCKQCGEDFYSAREFAEICSDECRKEYYKTPVWQREQKSEPQHPLNTPLSAIIGNELEPEQEYPTPRKYNPKRRLYKVKCVVCGQEYLTNNKHSIYCSVTCQQRKWKDDRAKEQDELMQELATARGKLAMKKQCGNEPVTKLELEYFMQERKIKDLQQEIEELRAELRKK